MPIRPSLVLLALFAAAPAAAEDVVRLSAAEREAAINGGRGELPINGAPGLGDGKIHGEMGMAVGSNGMRALYGSTVVPLGTTGQLGLAFSTVQGGRWRAR